MNCFIAWGDMIFKDGIGNFYSSDSFTDYPPGYMYILYMVGAIRHVLGVAWNSTLSVMLTKTPAIIADLATAYRKALDAEGCGNLNSNLSVCTGGTARWSNLGTDRCSIYLFRCINDLFGDRA